MIDPATVIRGYLTAGDSLDTDGLRRWLSPDVITHVAGGNTTHGLEPQLDAWEQAHEGLDKLRHDPLAVVVGESTVAARVEVSGVHTGVFLGIEPTGRSIHVDQGLFAIVSDGRIDELWEIVDTGAGFKQLGVLDEQALSFTDD